MKKTLWLGLFTTALLCAASSSAFGEVGAPKPADAKGAKVKAEKKHAKAANVTSTPDAKGAEMKVVKKQAKAANAPSIGSSFPRAPNGESVKSAPKQDGKL